MVFDRIVIQFMDSFVWCFLLLVSANCMIRITTAHHETTEVHIVDADETAAEVPKEKIVTSAPKESNAKELPQSRSQRLDLLDNIFNIPIATLKAVNELVQSIATNLHVGGDSRSSIKDTPARTTDDADQ